VTQDHNYVQSNSSSTSGTDVAAYISGKELFGHAHIECDYREDMGEFFFRCVKCMSTWSISNVDLAQHGWRGWKVPPCVPQDYELSTPFDLLRRVWVFMRTGTPDPNLLNSIYACLREAEELKEEGE
jgi:hypothetical protein